MVTFPAESEAKRWIATELALRLPQLRESEFYIASIPMFLADKDYKFFAVGDSPGSRDPMPDH
jgi:hypothetical protein